MIDKIPESGEGRTVIIVVVVLALYWGLVVGFALLNAKILHHCNPVEEKNEEEGSDE